MSIFNCLQCLQPTPSSIELLFANNLLFIQPAYLVTCSPTVTAHKLSQEHLLTTLQPKDLGLLSKFYVQLGSSDVGSVVVAANERINRYTVDHYCPLCYVRVSSLVAFSGVTPTGTYTQNGHMFFLFDYKNRTHDRPIILATSPGETIEVNLANTQSIVVAPENILAMDSIPSLRKAPKSKHQVVSGPSKPV